MKRQNLRKMLLIISLLLFPVTIWYMSPYLIIQGAMEGIVSGSFIVFACMLFGSIFFGRVFCGWLCPMGGLQECLFSVNKKVPKQGWRNYIKYVIWIVWIAVVIICFVYREKEISIDFFYMTDHGISIAEIYNYVIYYGVVILVLVPAVLFGKRVFCHYFCWMAPFMVIGTKIRRFLHLPGIHISIERKKCISCGMCSQSCPMGLNVAELIQDSQHPQCGQQGINHVTLPAAGGVDQNHNRDFWSECIQCGSCVDCCPKRALSYAVRKSR